MITLYTFGPAFGLPDPSPFVIKAELLLKLAGLPYRCVTGGFRKAPKGKLPYIDDDGERIADSTFIRWHIERKHRFDFDRGLDAEQQRLTWYLHTQFVRAGAKLDAKAKARLSDLILVGEAESGGRRYVESSPKTTLQLD